MPKTPRSKHKKSLKYKGFELFYKELALPVYKFLIRKTGGDAEATEEVCSRTFEAALKGWVAFGHRSSYFTWVCKIALNKLADYYRSQINERSRWIAPALEEIAKIEDKDLKPEERLALKQLRGTVRECLFLLPEEKRKLLYLRYWEELSLGKIAKVMGVSERAIEGKLYRAKCQLRVAMVEKYPEYVK